MRRRRSSSASNPEREAYLRKRPIDAASATSLSTDVLKLIFAYIPVRPRLLALSTVCTKWRNAALCSVVDLPWNSICEMSDMGKYLGLFANLNAIPSYPPAWSEEDSFWKGMPPLSYLQSHVVHNSTHAVRVDVDFLRRLTRLSHLSLSACSIDALSVAGLRLVHFSSLKRLSIDLSRSKFRRLNSATVQDTWFPLLSDFDMNDNTRPPVSRQLVANHMSQLVSLHVKFEHRDTQYLYPFPDLLSNAVLPNLAILTLNSRNVQEYSVFVEALMTSTPALTKLSLTGIPFENRSGDAQRFGLSSLVRLCPSIKDLTLKGVSLPVSFYPLTPLAPILTCFVPNWQDAFARVLDLTPFSRLTSFAMVDLHTNVAMDTTIRIFSQLRRLAIFNLHPSTVSELVSATALRSLRLSYLPESTSSVASLMQSEWHLPYLERIHLGQPHEIGDTRGNTVGFLMMLLSSKEHWPFARLRQVKLELDKSPMADKKVVVGDLLFCVEKLQRLGVERVIVKGVDESAVEMRAMLRAKKKELKWLTLQF